MTRRLTRRTFLKHTAVTGAAAPLLSVGLPGVRAAAPGSTLNIAAIGVGGKGWGDINNVSHGQNVVAICDIDEQRLAKAAKQFPGAKPYTDWRRLLEQKDIDACTVSTPDHTHAPAAMTAIQLGKHVYVQKPMAHDLYEVRQLTLAARQKGVVTQMGNQGHSGSAYRSLVQLIQSGAIGRIKEAHAWSNRPIWPQGIDRPAGEDPVPPGLNWDVWLGVAPVRPFKNGVYHPFKWRGWLDFGTGALGDMGCHIIDPIYWSLGLTAPTQIWSEGPEPNKETYPKWGVIHYLFPGTKHTADKTIQVTWHDGGRKPPEELAPLPDGKKLPSNGTLFIGEKGVVLTPHGPGGPQLLPEAKFRDHPIPDAGANDHYMQWTNACLGKDKTTSHFDYAGPLTETVLLGNLALRFPGQKLAWDAAALHVTNLPDANRFIRRQYRKGWQIKGLSDGKWKV